MSTTPAKKTTTKRPAAKNPAAKKAPAKPQDHQPKAVAEDKSKFYFTVDGKRYGIPFLTEEAAASVPGWITREAIMERDEEGTAHLRLYFAQFDQVDISDAARRALDTLNTRELSEVVIGWLGESGGSSD